MMTQTSSNAPQPPPNVANSWTSVHRCPACGSANVRRSTLRERERSVGEHKFHSPYRCRACNERFWVFSRRARNAATVAVACGAGLALLVALVVISVWDDDVADRISPAATNEATVPAEDEPAPEPPLPASRQQDPLSRMVLPPPVTPAPPNTKFEARPLRPPAQPFVK